MDNKATDISLTFLSRADIQSLHISPGEMIEAVEKAFTGKARGQTELPFKPTIHPRPDCFLRALPGYLQNPDVAGLKWVSAYPANKRIGLPVVGGLVILNDSQTGLPLAILEGSLVTAWRTAAVSALSAKLLARKGACELAICGAGVQGSMHLTFLPFALPGLREIRIFDSNPKVMRSFIEHHESQDDRFSIQAASSPQVCVRGADVVVTAAPMPEKPLAILTPENLDNGVLCMPLDLDSYFSPEAFKACDLFFSDDANQLFELQKQGRFKALCRVDGDYGELMMQNRTGRQNDNQRIMAISVGIALGDLAIAHLIYSKAVADGMGTDLAM